MSVVLDSLYRIPVPVQKCKRPRRCVDEAMQTPITVPRRRPVRRPSAPCKNGIVCAWRRGSRGLNSSRCRLSGGVPPKVQSDQSFLSPSASRSAQCRSGAARNRVQTKGFLPVRPTQLSLDGHVRNPPGDDAAGGEVVSSEPPMKATIRFLYVVT